MDGVDQPGASWVTIVKMDMDHTLTACYGIPVISLSGSLDFGAIALGSSAQDILTISNTGNAVLTVNGISYPNGFSASWSGTVPPGGSQPVTVTFAPTAIASYGGDVKVNAHQTAGVDTGSGTGTAVHAIETPGKPAVVGVSANVATISWTPSVDSLGHRVHYEVQYWNIADMTEYYVPGSVETPSIQIGVQPETTYRLLVKGICNQDDRGLELLERDHGLQNAGFLCNHIRQARSSPAFANECDRQLVCLDPPFE